MDGRRRRYVMHDVYFLDDSLGSAVFDQFGAAGIALWMGFIAACKKNHVQGQMSYSTDVEALAIFGLPGLNMVNNDGEPITLDAFWTLLARHKVVRRRRAARRTHVISTRWERWQHTTRTRDAGEQNRRSSGTNTDQTSDGYAPDSGLDTDTETETETKTALALVPSATFDDFWREYPKKEDKIAAERKWKTVTKTVDPAVLVEAARHYAANPNRSVKFTKNAATWLNAGSWLNPTTVGEVYDEPPVRYV